MGEKKYKPIEAIINVRNAKLNKDKTISYVVSMPTEVNIILKRNIIDYIGYNFRTIILNLLYFGKKWKNISIELGYLVSNDYLNPPKKKSRMSKFETENEEESISNAREISRLEIEQPELDKTGKRENETDINGIYELRETLKRQLMGKLIPRINVITSKLSNSKIDNLKYDILEFDLKNNIKKLKAPVYLLGVNVSVTDKNSDKPLPKFELLDSGHYAFVYYLFDVFIREILSFTEGHSRNIAIAQSTSDYYKMLARYMRKGDRSKSIVKLINNFSDEIGFDTKSIIDKFSIYLFNDFIDFLVSKKQFVKCANSKCRRLIPFEDIKRNGKKFCNLTHKKSQNYISNKK